MDSKEFIVSMEYQGYVYVGWAAGQFENDRGVKYPYYNMYVVSPVSSYTSADYEASGLKAEKKKCVSPDVWSGLEVGDRVKLWFDDRGRVIQAAIDE